jgi:CheY-like chemotaxis protein
MRFGSASVRPLRFRTARILFVENHQVFAHTVIEQFLSNHEVVLVATVAEAKQALTTSFDVVLVDYDLPDGKGTEVVDALNATADPLLGRRRGVFSSPSHAA